MSNAQSAACIMVVAAFTIQNLDYRYQPPTASISRSKASTALTVAERRLSFS